MSFLITASSEDHGAITPNGGVLVDSGEDQSFSFVAYAGYVIANVWVDGIPVGAVSTYEFTNVIADHTISVTFSSVAFDPVQFRLDFPEFANATTYPLSMINFWMGLGDTLLNVTRWGDRRPYGLSLFVAHNITLAAMDSASGAAGVTPGVSTNLVSSESAGPISYSLDTQSVSEQDGGNYNETKYGRQFLRLCRIVGIGGAQV
jgi:hypothetical protein